MWRRRHGGRPISSHHPPLPRRGMDFLVPLLLGCVVPEESAEHGCCCYGRRPLDFDAERPLRQSGATGCC